MHATTTATVTTATATNDSGVLFQLRLRSRRVLGAGLYNKRQGFWANYDL